MPVWIVNLIKKTFPQVFTLAELTKYPILGKAIDRMLFKGDDIIYLPQDKVIAINRSIGDPGSMVLPSQLVDHFIEKANYHWIMNQCLCRAASKCKDYPIQLGCLFLGEAAMGINPKLGRHVTRKEAHAHEKQCREAGLVHLIGRNKLDTVWLNVRPGDRLLTICNCCPCCCLWRILPHLDERISHKVKKMPGVSVMVTDRCEGCGTCTQDICFVDAISLVDSRAVISDRCRGCGRCISVCPNDAIEISIETPQGIEEAVHRLSSLVDVT
jgi:ferredoxin